ncbi:MAG: hypothetical protein EZS28_006392 [Streblomastix strix]|uniref:Uncharacterized protein n=1 Tax=Streblomastix strix TaxID=222440 RepID=A0A5J4WTF4_9EUKA|nr:MAG: hypothetical protein EZS28_006392 [Streblomastix strix]
MICFRREQEKGGVCSDSWVSKVQLRIYRASHIAFGTLPDSLVKSRGHSLFKRKFSAVAFTNVLEKLQQLYWKDTQNQCYTEFRDVSGCCQRGCLYYNSCPAIQKPLSGRRRTELCVWYDRQAFVRTHRSRAEVMQVQRVTQQL